MLGLEDQEKMRRATTQDNNARMNKSVTEVQQGILLPSCICW